MTNRLFKRIIAAIVGLSLATIGATSATAYPAGQDMALQLSKITNIVKGETLSVSASGVNPACPVTFRIASNQAGTGSKLLGTATANGSYQTGQVSFTAPTNTGDYYVFGSTGTCAAQGSSKTAMQQILVGKTLSIATAVNVNRLNLVTTAVASYASQPVSGLKVSVKMYDLSGSVVKNSGVLTTDNTGTVRYTISRKSIPVGNYVVKWFFQASFNYAPQVATKNVTLN